MFVIKIGLSSIEFLHLFLDVFNFINLVIEVFSDAGEILSVSPYNFLFPSSKYNLRSSLNVIHLMSDLRIGGENYYSLK